MKISLKRLRQEGEFWLGRRLPTCRELTPVLSQSLERRLTLRERLTLRLHFLICVYCVRYLEQLRLMRAAVRAREAQSHADDPGGATPSLTPEARERIRRALRER